MRLVASPSTGSTGRGPGLRSARTSAWAWPLQALVAQALQGGKHCLPQALALHLFLLSCAQPHSLHRSEYDPDIFSHAFASVLCLHVFVHRSSS